MLLTGKHALVTGSSQGIGRDIALLLASEGANVVINGLTKDLVDEVVEEISAAGGRAWGFAGSVAEPDNAKTLVEGCVETFGGIDILFNNAGTPAPETVEECSHQQWRDVMDTNLYSAYLCSHYAVPYMKEQRWGRIVFTSSLAATGFIGGSVYAASKAGLIGLSNAVARELQEDGITSNVICPTAFTPKMAEAEEKYGFVTDLTNKMFERGWVDKAQLDRILGKARPDGVAPFAVYLCLEEAASITGCCFDVEGSHMELLSNFVTVATLEHDYKNSGPVSLSQLRESVPKMFGEVLVK